jgi:uncharacterized membrane protein YdjX (TVP38/TMEM64 family)
MKKFKKYLPILLILLLSGLALSFEVHKYFSFDLFKEHQKSLESFIETQKFLSIIIYCGIYILIVGISIPGASFMTIAGGFLFGQVLGTMSAVIAATIGATILFLSARMASTDLLSKKSGSWINKMKDGFKQNAFSYLLTLRLIPIFPFAIINLAAAIFQIPLRIFFFGTLIGIIPGSFVYTSMGVALREVIAQPNFSSGLILNSKVLFSLAGLGLLALLPVLYKKFKKKKT